MEKIDEHRPVERQVRARIHHLEGYERQTQVVKDLNAQRRWFVSRLAQLIWLLFGILEVLIGLRVLLKLIAANPINPFAALVYAFTNLFLWPFNGLTVAPSFDGFVLEIPAIIGMFVYALVGWVIVRLFWLIFYNPTARTVRTIERESDHVPD